MSEYPLRLSDAELRRYRLMAEGAARLERDLWAAAGIRPGASVADVGCGPGAVSAVLARLVGEAGRVHAVDRDPEAVELARATVADAGVANVTVGVGGAQDTGIPPGSVDVVMIRHVLAHNGSREAAIVADATTIVRPGGYVYLADVEMTGLRTRPADPTLADLDARYREWHARRGNDVSVGLRLGELLTAAGLEAVEHHGRFQIIVGPPGFRTPAWAARDALVGDGLANSDDVGRWASAFDAMDLLDPRPTVFAPLFFAFGRRPA